MPATLWLYTSCHNCRFCEAGGRIHGPYPEYWEQAGKNHRIHRYGGSDGGSWSGGGGPVPEPPEVDGDPAGEAVLRYFSLPAEKQAEIEESLRAKGRVKRLKSGAKTAVSKAVEDFFEREGRLPDGYEHADIENRVLADRKKELAKAEKDSARRSDKLIRWRRREREQRRRDEEQYERDRERYEAQTLREMTVECKRTFFSVISDEGGIRRSKDTHEEWQEIPLAYRGGPGRGMTADDMAQHLSMAYPEFGIHDERDLMDFFTSGKYRTR